ncbi:MAG TPA: RNB domain-containing ribonuclease, partial [Pseudonocardia sp.]|nr:RNB domain-containing ribonuclease [Pseudonocardia sp.]
AGAELPDWLRAALPTLPELMDDSDALASRVDRACLDRTEAALLRESVGHEFDAVVLRADGDGDGGEVYVPDPPVLARCTGALTAGAVVRVRLEAADPETGRIEFAVS